MEPAKPVAPPMFDAPALALKPALPAAPGEPLPPAPESSSAPEEHATVIEATSADKTSWDQREVAWDWAGMRGEGLIDGISSVGRQCTASRR